jgi:putative lipoic acid-binding regulatory protein
VNGVKTHADTSGRTGRHVDGWAVPDPATIYPAVCHFRIIVDNDFHDEAGLQQVLAHCEIVAPLAPGRASAGGRYRSLQASVRVADRAALVHLHEGLRAVQGVRMVL